MVWSELLRSCSRCQKCQKWRSSARASINPPKPRPAASLALNSKYGAREQFWGRLFAGAMFLRHSHPVVHPDPAATAPAAQGPVAPAPAPVAQAAAAAAQAQGQGPAPAPAAAAQGANANAPPPGVQMVDPRGAPGTRWGLAARLAQALLAAAAVAFMASTDDFRALTAFRLLVAAESLQCLWSLGLAAVDVYALLVKRSFRTPRATTIYSTGDWVTGALSFAAASGSAAMTTLINNDLLLCSENHCPTYMAATAMAFLSWFAIAPSCVINLWAAVYSVQRA